MSIQADYLEWQSELSLEQVFQGAEVLAYPEYWAEGIVYLTIMPDQDSRATLVYRSLANPHNQQVLVPAPFNLRTRICEYGGKPFWLFKDELVFANDEDQRLYRTVLGRDEVPLAITENPAAEARCSYADLVRVSENCYLAIVEEHLSGAEEPASWLGLIDAAGKAKPPQRLVPQADFFSNLVIDPARQRIAWVQWQHPNMPWDETQLWTAQYEHSTDGFSLRQLKRIKLPETVSVCQLLMADDGKLFFVADLAGQDAGQANNFWNIWLVEDCGVKAPQARRITALHQEIGYPHWQYGDARLTQLDAQNLLAVASAGEGDQLYRLNLASMQAELIECEAVGFQYLHSNRRGQALLVARYGSENPQIASYSQLDGRVSRLFGSHSGLAQEEISLPKHIAVRAASAAESYAYYYAPRNSAYRAKENQAPPLLVMVHGGPTARAYNYFDLQKQFWTQRGFAVVDINHRGSCGYGRRYRDALYGQWGIADAEDIAAAVTELIEQGRANPQQVCIRGKSAGGYAVLRALTEFPNLFTAGACYYGIGNLVTLAESTHKFERYYTDRLIGEAYESDRAKSPDSAYFTRSPINKIERLQSAMIVFQGARDKVVPPAVAHEIISALKAQNIAHKYVEYATEGHGFRQLESNLDAWRQELEFYRQHLPARSE